MREDSESGYRYNRAFLSSLGFLDGVPDNGFLFFEIVVISIGGKCEDVLTAHVFPPKKKFRFFNKPIGH